MIDYESSFSYTLGGAFPNTTGKNVTAPGSGDGTEFVKLFIDDIWGRAQALMSYAGLTPDGVSEAPGTAQILQAIGRGFAVGPGMGVTYWKNGTPAANGDRVLLLQGQVILIASYPLLAAACYVGDANNGTAAAFYKTSDAGGTTRDTAGTYMVLPDTRECVLVGVGTRGAGVTAHDTYTLGQFKDDQFQGWQLGGSADDTGTRDYYSRLTNRDQYEAGVATPNQSLMWQATNYQGGANIAKAMNDGTNGTPRSGTTTHGKQIGTYHGITY